MDAPPITPTPLVEVAPPTVALCPDKRVIRVSSYYGSIAYSPEADEEILINSDRRLRILSGSQKLNYTHIVLSSFSNEVTEVQTFVASHGDIHRVSTTVEDSIQVEDYSNDSDSATPSD
ncbi:hypothetical protein L6452_36035 [Arctium lappa]|uniref:Uncharacterized protein n=1 Tax=Arctium lappa TaxID=4217 RepID=A0ACB8Y8T8_ARCLA|nr:hypothetical protein L6452_36035 [Arctium lappa]